jgi:hypothetical protein
MMWLFMIRYCYPDYVDDIVIL